MTQRSATAKHPNPMLTLLFVPIVAAARNARQLTEGSFPPPDPMKTKYLRLLKTLFRVAIALMFCPVLLVGCHTVRIEGSPPTPVLQGTVSGKELTSAEDRKLRNPKTPFAEAERLIKKGPHIEIVKQR